MVMFYLTNQEEIKQDREMNTNRMFKEKKINSVIRKQEGQLLRVRNHSLQEEEPAFKINWCPYFMINRWEKGPPSELVSFDRQDFELRFKLEYFFECISIYFPESFPMSATKLLNCIEF